jgi:hypothetical protein
MAKQSPAKSKKLRGEAMRAAAKRKENKASNQSGLPSGEIEADSFAEVDGEWKTLGLAAPARRALINDGLYTLSDLRKVSLNALKDLHGMGPNAIRILTAAMKKADLSFRK